MMRPARPDDLDAITALLRDHLYSSMFPLMNLQSHGLGSDAPRGLSLSVSERNGTIDGVFGITNEGMVMPQMPALDSADLDYIAQLIDGRALMGLLGPPAQVRPIAQRVGVAQAEVKVDHDDPAYDLDLAHLVLPDCTGLRLSAIDDSTADAASAFRAAFNIEALGSDPAKIAQSAKRDIARYRAADTHRLLMRGDQPVAMTGFNARLADVVQIGGVYTPPEHRGKGYAGCAVALHLTEVWRAGITRSVLFAASKQAARAYEKIGFTHVGTFTLMLFKTLQEARA